MRQILWWFLNLLTDIKYEKSRSVSANNFKSGRLQAVEIQNFYKVIDNHKLQECKVHTHT